MKDCMAGLGENITVGVLMATTENSLFVLETGAILPPLLGGLASLEQLAGISEGDTGHPTHSCRTGYLICLSELTDDTSLLILCLQYPQPLWGWSVSRYQLLKILNQNPAIISFAAALSLVFALAPGRGNIFCLVA